MLEVTAYEPIDFPLLASWWKSRMSLDLNPGILSDTGYIVNVDDIPVAALFLYPIQGSDVCWLGWPIADPESSSETRSEALDALLEVCHLEARRMGYKLIWTTSGVPALQDRMQNHGYKVGDTNITQYWKEL